MPQPPVGAVADRLAQQGQAGAPVGGLACVSFGVDGAHAGRIWPAGGGASTPGEPRIGLVSNVSGQLAGPGYGSAQYWVEHVRQPVRFVDGVRAAESLGAGVFVEVGPGGGLSAAVEQSLTTQQPVSVVTMAKDQPEIDSLLAAAGRCSPPAWGDVGLVLAGSRRARGSSCQRTALYDDGFGWAPGRDQQPAGQRVSRSTWPTAASTGPRRAASPAGRIGMRPCGGRVGPLKRPRHRCSSVPFRTSGLTH